MSPTSRELVSNKPLAGTELAQIILADAARILGDHGLLAGQSAYSRIAYDLRLTLHLDLPSMPTSVDHVTSRPRATDEIASNPSLAAIEAAPPLASPRSPDAILHAVEVSRDIQSPNLARVEHSLPIEVSVTGQDGHATERLVTYHSSDVGMRPEEFVEPGLRDVTDEVRKELGL